MSEPTYDIRFSKFHRARYDYCFQLLVRDLIALNDDKVLGILYRYSCAPRFDWGSPSLRFPSLLKEEDLPEHVRLINEPKND